MPTGDQDNTRPDPKGTTVVSSPDPAAQHSPTQASKVRWRIWPCFGGCGLMALSDRRQTSLNQMSEETRHEYLSD
jgi:hypothetical protein